MKLVRKGLMLAALTALGLTMSAGIASATPVFNSAAYPAVVSGTAIGEEEVTFETQLGSTLCDEVNTTAVLTTWSSSLNATPSFGTCIGGPVEMNGCTFAFHTGAQISESEFSGTLSWGGCSGITTNPSGCKMKFAPTSGINVTYDLNALPYSLRVIAQGSGLKYTKECGADKGKVFSNGRFYADWGFMSSNGPLTILPDNGLFLTGENSEEATKQPKVNAERYVAKLLGVQAGPAEEPFHEFETKALTIECEQLEFTGQISAASSDLTMNPNTYGGCAGGLQKATVKPNSCHYVFHVLNAGPPYTGSADIACLAGHEIEAVIPVYKGTCYIDVPAQSGLKGISLANVGSGSSRTVKMTFNLTGIKYNLSGNCGKTEGTYTDGSYRGVTTLSAVN